MEADKEKSHIQLDLAKKDRDLEKAFKKKDFRVVSELRKEINELRRKLLTLKGKEEDCKLACRPDVVKEAECGKIVEQIAKMEADDAPEKGDPAKIDALYKDLSLCNQELKKLREIHKKPSTSHQTH